MRKKTKRRILALSLLSLLVVGSLMTLAYLGFIKFASIGKGWSTYDECVLAKSYYIRVGCNCPTDGWDCNYAQSSGYVLHCDGCPSTIGGEIPHYDAGRCVNDNSLCIDAENKGLISCGGTWTCVDYLCVCGQPTTTTIITTTTHSTTTTLCVGCDGNTQILIILGIMSLAVILIIVLIQFKFIKLRI